MKSRGNFREAAVRYLKYGWTPMPVWKNKVPCVEWRELQRIGVDREQIEIWAEQYPDAQIGIVTGTISNLVVVDIDGEEGMKTFKELDDGTPTVYSKTGSGGRHYFFAMPKEEEDARLLRNFAKRRGIDLRANGGYVVVPPSHNDNGLYEWQIGPDKQGPAECPQWIIDMYKESTGVYNGKPLLSEIAEGVPEGQRNDTAARLAGKFIRQGLSVDEVLAIMSVWNQNNNPPLDEKELWNVIRSIEKAEEKKSSGEPDHVDIDKAIDELSPDLELYDLTGEIEERGLLNDLATLNKLKQEGYIQKFTKKFNCFDYAAGRALKANITKLREELDKQAQMEEFERLGEEKKVQFTLSEEEKRQALEYLKDPHLLQRIQKDISEAGGIVGEEINIKFLYLAATSRLMEVPINVIIFAQSSTGKSYLVNIIAEFIPPEGKLILSSVSARALEYVNEEDIQHKFLLIQELDGADEIMPTLRVLQSEGRLARLVTIQDPQTNKMKADVDEKDVYCATVVTTTAGDVYDENSTRIFEMYLDESVKQTKEIVSFNLKKASLEYLSDSPKREQVKKLHHNVQRLLERIEVSIPYAHLLQFPADTIRNRRDSARFVQFIKVIAFLHQKQRQIKETNDGIKYIVADLQDYKLSYEIGLKVLRRTLDELSDRSRKVLKVIMDYVNIKGIAEASLTRKNVQEHGKKMDYDFSNDKDLVKQLGQLIQLEYIEVQEGGQGKAYKYKLEFSGDPDAPEVEGLLTPEDLKKRLDGMEKMPKLESARDGSPDGVVEEEAPPGLDFDQIDRDEVKVYIVERLGMSGFVDSAGLAVSCGITKAEAESYLGSCGLVNSSDDGLWRDP